MTHATPSTPRRRIATAVCAVAGFLGAGVAWAGPLRIDRAATVASPAVRVVVFPVAPEPVCSIVNGFLWHSKALGAGRHQGVDIVTEIGQSVYAMDDGVLYKKYENTGAAGYGWALITQEGDTEILWRYFHLDSFAEGLQEGDRVVRGQVIGTVGETGNAAGPHLHFERRIIESYWASGTPRVTTAVDPMGFLTIPSVCRDYVTGKSPPAVGQPSTTTTEPPPPSSVPPSSVPPTTSETSPSTTTGM